MVKMTMVNDVAGGLLPLKLRAAGLDARRRLPAPCPLPAEVSISHLWAGGNSNNDDARNIHQTLAQKICCWSNKTWEACLGRPIKQTNGTCVLVACILCLEALHRLEYEKAHGPGFPDTRRALALQTLFNMCSLDETWVEGAGTKVSNVLNKIQKMRTLLTTDEPSKSRALPLRSWRMHAWEDGGGTGLSQERVKELLHAHGPAVGILWVQPPYYDLDAGSDAAGVYRGCGRDDAARAKSKKDLGNAAAWHAVVCIGYRSWGDQLHVLVLDNHDEVTGPRRWIDSQEIDTLYTLTVEPPALD